jgi:cell wall-associated NlpC family hydrolase
MGRNLLFLITILSSGCAAISPPATVRPTPVDQPGAIQPPRAERSEALLQTLLALGLDYHHGGSSHATGFDCSGLVAHVYQQAWGIRLPRTSLEQSRAGVPIGLGELQAGDLVFYNTLNRPFSHVGIYVGDGRFVHAPKSGARVRVESLHGAYWKQRFNGARRIERTT